MTLTLIDDLSRIDALELWRWLNDPRAPNFEDGGPVTVEGLVAMLEARSSESFYMLCGDSAVPIAFAGFAPAGRYAGWFHGVVVAPELRGRGLGRELLVRVWAELQARGVLKASALMFADNDAIRATFASAGATEEGYLARAAMRGGRMADMSLWSFTARNGESA